MTQKTKWTLGPWVAQKGYGHEPEHISWTIRPKGSSWESVATAWRNLHPESRVTRDAMDANANLIAAAPELYDALESVVRIADRDTVEFAAARAALAKARGETE